VNFHWQDGYAAFSVSESNAASVRQYIADQKEHHWKRSFQEELIQFLRKHGVEYDERYVWT
jgi:folate-dependent phosphoribosylglycinamide formyltransferase PurN